MRIPALIACSLAPSSPGFARDFAAKPIREFRFVERFGVAHPKEE